MATYTNLNNEIFAQSAIQGLCKILLPLSRFSHNFSPDSGQRGDQVLVPLISTLTATTFGGSYAVCGGTKTVATINLTNQKVVQVGQSDITAWSSSVSNLEDFGYQMGKALGTLVLTDILSLVTTANFTSAAITTVSFFGLNELRAARLALNVANVPTDPRSILLDCTPYDQLLGITNFVQAQMFKDQSVLQEGRVMRALGMDFYEINALFAAANSIMAFVAHPDSIAIGMRYLQPQKPEAYSDAHSITDPETGLTVGLRDHYDPNTGSRYINLECLYGYTVGLTNCGRIIKRTD
jgi:hypothetical protein